jgi:hypothetical protein
VLVRSEAAGRQRAWPDVIRAARGLLDDPGAELARVPVFRYRLAVALVPLVIVAVAAKSDFDTRLGRLLGGLPSPPGPAAAQASPDAEPFSDLRRPDSASHRGRS